MPSKLEYSGFLATLNTLSDSNDEQTKAFRGNCISTMAWFFFEYQRATIQMIPSEVVREVLQAAIKDKLQGPKSLIPIQHSWWPWTSFLTGRIIHWTSTSSWNASTALQSFLTCVPKTSLREDLIIGDYRLTVTSLSVLASSYPSLVESLRLLPHLRRIQN